MTSVSPMWLGLIAVIGLVLGSFINVVSYRVPRGQSIAFPASRCPHCLVPIKPRHNVPVVGWVTLRGRCASCRMSIARRYVLVEAGTALLMVAVTLRFGLVPELPAYLFFACIAVTLGLIDAEVRRLPDSIVLTAYLIASLLLMPAGAAHGSAYQAVRGGLGIVALWSIYFALQLAGPQAITSGDVKLAGLLGLFLGWLSWGALLVGIVIGLMIGGVVGIARSIAGPRHTAAPVAYGPCMIGGAATALFVTAPVLGWYGALIGVS